MDISVDFHGTLVIANLHSDEAVDWWDENVAQGIRWGAIGRVVEPRFIEAIVMGAREAGLIVEGT